MHQSASTHAQITRLYIYIYIDIIMYSTWDMSRTNARSCEIMFEILINSYTLPETNIAPENRHLQKEIPTGNQHV